MIPSSNRQAANIQNSQHSTGPKTEDGKSRVVLNGLSHGLTGQTVVLPSDDLAAYNKFTQQFHDELKPSGVLESQLVQTISDTYWRLNRVTSMENSLFSLSIDDQPNQGPTPEDVDVLAKLSLYESRLNRKLEKAKAELKQLQQERKQAVREALVNAAEVLKMKQALKESWNPSDDG